MDDETTEGQQHEPIIMEAPVMPMMAIPATGILYLTPMFTGYVETPIMEYKPGFKFKVVMPEGSKKKKRWTIILFSGGGTLEFDGLMANAIELSSLGYNVVMGQYKDFIGDFGDWKKMKESVVNAYQLIKYLRMNAATYTIQKNAIFGIGTSAGGFTWAQAAITANDTQNSYYDGYVVPDIERSLRAVACLSGAVNPEYMNLIQASSVRTNFFNGAKDKYNTAPTAQKACEKELSFGVPSMIKIYPDSDHSIGEHDDIYYNPSYGIVYTFYNTINAPTS